MTLATKRKAILVIGGGIAGLTAALEAAETGAEVVLVEKSASLGGRVAAFNQYFPKLCPPSCGLEINFRRLKNNPRIRVFTLAEVESIQGVPGDYQVVVQLAPRYVTAACTLCGACVNVCPAEVGDEFNWGRSQTKAVHLPFATAYPALYKIERSACPAGCHACVEACAYSAIDLAQAPEKKTLQVAAVVVATGWEPYDAAKLDNLGYGKHANVVTNVLLERLAAPDGPTGGSIVRPSDGKKPSSVAFVQCAGSRDQNHLPYCSGVCCSASLKQVTYIRSRDPEAQITMFYIDVRTPGHLEEFGSKTASEAGLELIKGKVGKVEEDPGTGDLVVTVEDVMHGARTSRRFQMVVLATGMVPRTRGLPAGITTDEFGFVTNANAGIYGAGCAKRPAEVSASVRDATGAALKALQIAMGATHG
jgi:quinone-modifying oxidoreductase subunit QmoA